MSNFSMKSKINASADKVWKTLSDISGVEKYIPLITACTVEGSGPGAKRTCTMEDGGKLFETINSIDHQARTLTYTIDEAATMPIEDYVGTMKIKGVNESQCEMEWSSTFKPKGLSEEEVKKMLENVYTSTFDGLNKLHA